MKNGKKNAGQAYACSAFPVAVSAENNMYVFPVFRITFPAGIAKHAINPATNIVLHIFFVIFPPYLT